MYDEDCETLARRFLYGEPDEDKHAAELAQVIQDAVEAWFNERDRLEDGRT